MTVEQPILNLLVIGAGGRGEAYTNALKTSKFVKITGIADPNTVRLKNLKNFYLGLRPDMDSSEIKEYSDWKNCVEDANLYHGVLICVMDQMHRDVAVTFADLGKHLLCEKPMATTWQECKDIFDAVIRNNVLLAVGHVLRYSPHNVMLKSLLDEGAVGDIVNINHTEPVGFQHFAHSYVRGNWKNQKTSTFSLMAKCCHDIDVLMWILGSDNCKKISSFGSLSHFKKSKKPLKAGNAVRCLDCEAESNCCYSAKKIYFDSFEKGSKGWPVRAITDIEDIPHIIEALENSDYGKCVYESDNNVLDNQIVSLDFGDVTATMTMVAFSKEICFRKMCFYGTKGEIYSDSKTIQVYDFLTDKTTEYKPEIVEESGHGGGDLGLAACFAGAMRDVIINQKPLAEAQIDNIKCTPMDMLVSHKVVFLAEQARLKGTVVDINDEIISDLFV
ncbi:hypothetical protein PACTADRAFT_68093 [Pachysolen tannophilus NRRL Y-2460]|uniref:Gfo/Idh/MocA-like oxidoreductase N-terminal domain-containing protein n=1 Tax=Pachysolen tannophilus NRRL Y-2460 TaxID=669874 RepID=A0A1E4TXN9_PACTA|nr:hypothetical protein PACTADRAFT_68093 [Pachysolen tannophilus NRRL Y-2460]